MAPPQQQPTRTVPMKVLVLGLARTGTTSIATALRRLGYIETHHMYNIFANREESAVWNRAFEAKYSGKGKFDKEDWDALLGNCQAVTDLPASAFGAELMKYYPDAKVILSVRDADSWHRSCMQTIYPIVRNPLKRFVALFDPQERALLTLMSKIWDDFFQGEFPTRGKEIFHAHNEEIRRLAPKDNFLEFSVKEGWGPLCEFLGDPVPDIPFPNTNDASNYEVRRKAGQRKLVGQIFGKIVFFGGAVVAGMFAMQWYGKVL